MDGLTLPDAAWRTRPGMTALLDALDTSSGATRFVGGAVRDTLAGNPVSDVDLATRLLPEDVLARLEAAGIKAVPTGLAHGTITAVLRDGPVEVTTLRRDVSTDGRRATIAFSDDWREDAARRDFTINALYADPASGRVEDYFGGVADLAAGIVRFIGDARERIGEDHLRILRFFRFHARYGRGAPEAEAYDACAACANSMMALSRERIADELLKLLATADPAAAVGLMLDRAILAPVLPEIDAGGRDRLAALVRAEAESGIAPDRVRRLIALLPQDARTADGIVARLRLSNAIRKRAATLLGNLSAARPNILAHEIGVPAAVDRLLLEGKSDAARAIHAWVLPEFPVRGDAMLAKGLRGPEIAAALKRARAVWAEEDFPNAVRVDAIVGSVVDQLLLERQNSSAASGPSGSA